MRTGRVEMVSGVVLAVKAGWMSKGGLLSWGLSTSTPLSAYPRLTLTQPLPSALDIHFNTSVCLRESVFELHARIDHIPHAFPSSPLFFFLSSCCALKYEKKRRRKKPSPHLTWRPDYVTAVFDDILGFRRVIQTGN